jgi:hypothetical protein
VQEGLLLAKEIGLFKSVKIKTIMDENLIYLSILVKVEKPNLLRY